MRLLHKFTDRWYQRTCVDPDVHIVCNALVERLWALRALIFFAVSEKNVHDLTFSSHGKDENIILDFRMSQFMEHPV